MERKLIIEPIKKGDLSKLCLSSNKVVDSCIRETSALDVTSNKYAIMHE